MLVGDGVLAKCCRRKDKLQQVGLSAVLFAVCTAEVEVCLCPVVEEVVMKEVLP